MKSNAKNDIVSGIEKVVSKSPEVSNPALADTDKGRVQSLTEEEWQGQRQGQDEEVEHQTVYIKGWRLYMLMLGIWIALFLSTLETTIVSTSLVDISDSLNGFQLRNWIVTSYLLTYTGFLIIYAKLSSIFGNKTMLLLALAIFTAFSIGCGVTNSITALIILRAFQGIGASGIYSMVLVLAPTLVPKKEYGKYIAIISSVFVIASALGPILGGAITTHTTWRWVFLLNAPGGSVAIVLITMFLPSETQDQYTSVESLLRTKFSGNAFKRVDTLGAFLVLAASVLLVFALEEGGSRYAWNSAAVISSLTLSCVAWVGFVVWEVWLERSNAVQEPIFPMRLLKSRVLSGMMLTTFFIGFPFVSIVVNIPQRAQAANGYSPISAGLALLALLLSSPLATMVSGYLTSNLKIPPVYLIFIGAILQAIGVGLTIRLPSTGGAFPKEQYGYEVIMGLGFGLVLATVLTLAQLVCDDKEKGLVMGALTQVRVMGGTISLAICSAVVRNFVTPSLAEIVSPQQLLEISDSLSNIEKLSPVQIEGVRNAFAGAYSKQMQLLTAFSAAALLASLLLWERKPRVFQ